jgi:hypothetical protein
MNATKTQHKWTSFLKFYSEQYKGRKTRLGVFENTGDVVNDYWLEDGLPLLDVSVQLQDDTPVVELMFASYSHPIPAARSLRAHYSLDGDEDGLDITGSHGRTTVLRFEKK